MNQVITKVLPLRGLWFRNERFLLIELKGNQV